MNYRHAFHAGSFADVFKHAVLCRILHYLRAKPAPYRVIDTHAGAGLYDLAGPEASRGGEWHDGIERLMAAQLAAPVAARYGWADAPVCTLFNAAGLPAEPFRTDDWPVGPANAPAR